MQAWIYEKPDENVCVAFLTNIHPKTDATIKFRGTDYFLPRRSISILPDCKTVVFNTQRVWVIFEKLIDVFPYYKTNSLLKTYHYHFFFSFCDIGECTT